MPHPKNYSSKLEILVRCFGIVVWNNLPVAQSFNTSREYTNWILDLVIGNIELKAAVIMKSVILI